MTISLTPRIDRIKQHRLPEIVTIAVCALISGADSWVDIATNGRSDEAWLRTCLPLPHGIPSHETFGRVFVALDPEQFELRLPFTVRAIQFGGGSEFMAGLAETRCQRGITLNALPRNSLKLSA